MSRLLLIPLALVLLLAGAMMLSGTAAEKRADFTFVDRGDIKTLDLPRLTYMQDIRIAYALFEGLYAVHPLTLDPIPGTADRIDISDDKKTYTFHIRNTAKWSNGDPVVAADFVFAWKRMLDESGDYAELFNYIQGAEEYQKALADKGKGGPPPDFTKVGVETRPDDPSYLRVQLKNPTVFFPDLVAFTPFFPSHAKSMLIKEDKSGEMRVNPKYTRPPNLVGNGPYRLDKWEFKRKIRLVANDYYWDKPGVKSKTIDMLAIDDPQNCFAAYESGAVDWWNEVPGTIGGELLKRGRTDLHVFTSFGTYFYSFNCRPTLPGGADNPLKDVRVRQALSMAIEKQFIVDHITRMGQPVATQYIPPGAFKAYQPPQGLPFDVQRARQLLSDAGFRDGHGFPQLKINFNTEGQHKEIAEYVQRQWRDHLSINVELDGKELKTFSDQLRNKQYSISRASWYGDYNDPSTFTDKYLPGGGNNDSDWNNERFAKLCDDATRETDQTKRLRVFHDAEQILLDESPILPLFHYVNSHMRGDNVKGIPENARNSIILKSAEVVRKR